jgi:protease-4
MQVRQYIDFFRQSGKFSLAYLSSGGEKEYFLASACAEVFVPPSASLSLRGLAVSGACDASCCLAA